MFTRVLFPTLLLHSPSSSPPPLLLRWFALDFSVYTAFRRPPHHPLARSPINCAPGRPPLSTFRCSPPAAALLLPLLSPPSTALPPRHPRPGTVQCPPCPAAAGARFDRPVHFPYLYSNALGAVCSARIRRPSGAALCKFIPPDRPRCTFAGARRADAGFSMRSSSPKPDALERTRLKQTAGSLLAAHPLHLRKQKTL